MNRPAHYTPNESLTLKERLNHVLAALERRRDELTSVLPPDIPFPMFHAIINQALRANPELLDCTPASIINACVKAGYDGLRVDGVEAAIVWEMATIRTPGQPDRKEKQARYMPMYRGLVQQVLRGGMVLACEADIIYEHDEYEILSGTDRRIFHRPRLEGDRGRPVAVYNVATLPSGFKATAYMTAAEVREVQKESRSGWNEKDQCSKGVWARWEGEQWKKTVLRRHRKTLPVGRDIVIRDSEQDDDFPQFAPSAPHPALSDTAPAGPRPTRSLSQSDRDVPLDLGTPHHHIVQSRDDEASQQREPIRQKDNGGEPVVMNGPANHLPDGDVEWDVWACEMEALIARSTSVESLMQLQNSRKDEISCAPKDVAQRVAMAFTDRAADLAAGATDDAAGVDGDDDDAAGA